MKKSHLLLFILLILLVTGIFYSLVWPQVPITLEDTRSYLPIAADLADGQLSAYHFRTLGYPALLLLTGSTTAPTRALFILQLAMYFASVLLLTSILLREHLPPLVIGIFVLLALLPPAVEYTAYALPEIATMFFLTLGFAALYESLKKNRVLWGLAAGLALGVAALIRPDYQLLPLFLALLGLILFLALKRFGSWLKTFLPMLLVAMFCLLGYMGFNALKFNHFSLAYFSGFTTTAKSVNMLEDIPESYGEIKQILIQHRNAELVSGVSHTAVNYIYEAMDELQAVTGLDRPELAGMLQKLTISLILRNPLRYLVSVGSAMANYLMPSASSLAIFSSQYVQLLWTAIHFLALLVFVLLLCALLGSLVLLPLMEKKSRQKLVKKASLNLPQLTLFLVTVASSVYAALVSTMLAVGDARYHVPTMLFSLFACLVFIHFLLKRRNNAFSLDLHA